jgi:hypothetical protein
MKLLHFGWLALAACATGTTEATPPRLAPAVASPIGIIGTAGPSGLTVVGDTPDLHFRLLLSGNHVAIGHGDGNFIVDDIEAQVSTVAARDISPATASQSGIELLRTHARWQCARMSEALGHEVAPEEIEILTSEKMPAALVWSAGDLLYVTAAYDHNVVALSVRSKAGVDLAAKAEYWMASLSVSPYPIASAP